MNNQKIEANNGERQPALSPATGSATGWWNPTPYSKRRRVIFHYVAEDGRTLCRKWAYVGLGTLEEGNDDHWDNCSECKKKKLALNAKSAKSPNADIRRAQPDSAQPKS